MDFSVIPSDEAHNVLWSPRPTPEASPGIASPGPEGLGWAWGRGHKKHKSLPATLRICPGEAPSCVAFTTGQTPDTCVQLTRIHSLVDSFIQQTCVEYPLCAGHLRAALRIQLVFLDFTT